MKFHRGITPLSLLLAGISTVIGSGWLFGPLFAAQIAGPAALISWFLGGLLMTIIALTFAELGTAFPVAGGIIQFAQESHGPLMSFMIGWMVWVSSVSVAPVETLGLIQYASNYLPGLMHSVNNTHLLTLSGILVASTLMFLMCLLNVLGARFFSRANTLITFIKLIVPVATILILMISDFHYMNFVNPDSGRFLPYGWHGVVAALPAGGIIYSFIGSNTILQLASETKNPHRSIPLALIGSMVSCMLLYVLLQIAFIGAISPHALMHGWKDLHFMGDNGPFAGIMMALGLFWFVFVIYADAFISPFGTAFVYTASTARISYGLSDIGFLPSGLKKLNRYGVPWRSILFNYVIGLLLFLPFPAWQKLVGFIISCFIVSYIIGPISLIALRKVQPELHRPFTLPFAYIIALLAFYICNLLIFWTGWDTVYKMMIALMMGLFFYTLHGYRIHDKNWLLQWKTSGWLVPYFISMACISYSGTFGGGRGWIPFGVDFAVMGVLTVFVFCLALYSISFRLSPISSDKTV